MNDGESTEPVTGLLIAGAVVKVAVGERRGLHALDRVLRGDAYSR
jgi:hypothetical protein